MVPEFYEIDKEDHTQLFWEANAKYKFCSVNVTAVFEHPDWQRFFEAVKVFRNESFPPSLTHAINNTNLT